MIGTVSDKMRENRLEVLCPTKSPLHCSKVLPTRLDSEILSSF